MKLTKLTALVTAMGLSAIVGTASAENLGEVWMTDQANGTLYVYSQDELDTDPANADPLKIDLAKASNKFTNMNKQASIVNAKNHLVGFNNFTGLDPLSRAQLAYLGGDMQVWKTHGKKGNPELIFSEHVTTSANSLHMCGGNPQNTKLACSSIGGKEIIIYDADYTTDTYTRQGGYALSSMPISASALPQVAGTYAAISGGKPICNNYDTSGSFLYVTINTGGMAILDVTGAAPEVINAYGPDVISATGCGLVNSPDGAYMWTNAGSKNPDDDEAAYRWNFGNITTAVPPTVVDLPEVGQGDVHGAQFAGLGGGFLWELMRLDDVIHVIDYSPAFPMIVNKIDLAALTGLNSPAGDVLDRSALGTRMYISQRGFNPITAIVGIVDTSRSPGVTVLSTTFGYDAGYVGHHAVRSGTDIEICVPNADGDDHDHNEDDACPEGTEVAIVDNADPHGLKSLSYTAGF